MPILKRDDAEIHYEEVGSGYPVVLFAPGGMRSAAAMWHSAPGQKPKSWNDWTEVLAGDYRVIVMDQRNAGASIGAIEGDHGWYTYAADQLALADHLGMDRFHTLGGCIGSSFCLKIAELAPGRVTSMVLQNPIGLNPDEPTYFPDSFETWAADLMEDRPELDGAAVASFGRNLWDHDFVFAVDRDFVSRCEIPALVLPGDDTPHPQAIGLELADLLPNAELLKDWKGPDHLDEQRERVTAFLAKHTP